MGSGVGWMVHPPTWGLGRELEAACYVANIQRLVDSPKGLIVDRSGDMVFESWKDRCENM